MRLLLLAVLALAAVALGATREPHEGCDYDFGAGNGTAYLVVNNPYNLNLSLVITYQIGERKNSTALNVSNTRVIAFCGLGHGWLYIQQNASQPGSPLMWYPLAVPRYAVLRADESATIFVTTLFAPAVTISIAILLIVAITLRPRLRRSAVYALPDELRGMDIRELLSLLLFFVFISFLLFVLRVYEWSPSPELASLLFNMYISLTLGSFYLSFRRGLWTYYFLFISSLINAFLIIKATNSPVLFVLFVLLFIIWYGTILLTSSVALLSFYNLLVLFFLSTYGIAIFIYYDMNFGYIMPWSLPLQTPVISPVQVTLHLPEILADIILVIVTFGIVFFAFVSFLAYILSMYARAVTPHTVSLPPLWWWFGLGVFAWDELEARSLLYRLSASGIVVAELSKGERAIVVSADLDGMYLCRFGRRSGVCNNVEWVRYDEVKFKVITIRESGERLEISRFLRKVVLPILIGFFAFFITDYINTITCITFIIFMLILLLYVVCDKYLKGYIKDARQKKVFWRHFALHVTWAFMFTLIFFVLISNWMIWLYVLPASVVVSFLSWGDPKLSRFLFLWLEIRLTSVGGLVIGLARGGCLRWTKVGAAPEGHDIVIRDEDCEVVVSPYVKQKESRPQCALCGPACPPLRIIGGERVAVRVKDGQKEYCYYVLDSSMSSGKSVRLFECLTQVWRHMLGMRRRR
jgi:hypothetical protein